MGLIFTFYSYKGGVGRTMAIANIAALLTKNDYKVLVVDWDLEAPGLDRYFDPYLNSSSKLGLLDLLENGVVGGGVERLAWESFIAQATIDDHRLLSLLRSGDRGANYSQRVLRFDWGSFFESRDGGHLLENMRNEWKQSFDFVFIDSRTGITDASGICTIFMPDVLTLMFTANRQSVEGARSIALKAQEARQKLQFDRMPLLIYPLASRFEGRSEYEEAQEWLEEFAKNFSTFMDDWRPTTISPLSIIESTKLPYVPFFSFGEKIPALSESLTDPESLSYAYNVSASLVSSRFDITTIGKLENANVALYEDGLSREDVLRVYVRSFLDQSTREFRSLVSLSLPEIPQKSKAFQIDKLLPELDNQQLEGEPKRLLVLGHAGSGKSTLALRLCHSFALQAQESPKIQSMVLPVWLRLEEMQTVGWKRFSEDQSPSADQIWDLVDQIWSPHRIPQLSEALLPSALNGRCLIVFDGLDHVERSAQPWLRSCIDSFAERYPLNDLVVTCRTHDYYEFGKPFKAFETIELGPLDDGSIRRMISGWYSQLESLGLVGRDMTEELSTSLYEAVRQPQLREFAGNPLFLTLIALLYTQRGRLNEGRAKLFEDLIDVILWRWDQIKARERPVISQLLSEADRTIVDLKLTLSEIAFKSLRTGTAYLPEYALVKAFAALHPHGSLDWANQVIDAIRFRSGLLAERQAEEFAFVHRSFHEYLAACWLSSEGSFVDLSLELLNSEERSSVWRTVLVLAASRLVFVSGDIERPLLLIAELLAEQPQEIKRRVDVLSTALEVVNEVGPTRIGDRRLGRLLLAKISQSVAEVRRAEGVAASELTEIERMYSTIVRVVPSNLLDDPVHSEN